MFGVCDALVLEMSRYFVFTFNGNQNYEVCNCVFKNTNIYSAKRKSNCENEDRFPSKLKVFGKEELTI